jgi:hypothetical protein
MSGSWWWCLDHAAVEPDAGCRNAVRLGPYESSDVAEQALELAHRRTEEWDADDRRPPEEPSAGEAAPPQD